MLYIVAFLCPPLAVLLTGRIFTAIFVLFLSLVYFPGALVALLVVSGHYADKRTGKLLKAGERQHRAAMKAGGKQHEAMLREMRDIHESTTAQNKALYEASMRQALAAERQAAAAEKALGPQQRPARSLPPASPGSQPAPEPDAIDVEFTEVEPKPTARERFEILLAQTKFAYDSLPEWGQPVVWGLAAATPVVTLIAAVMAMR